MINKIVYHGDENKNIKHDLVFFSTDRNFASDYGDVESYHLTINNPFHTCEKEHVERLLDLMGLLVDSYDNAEYQSYADLEASSLMYTDTWELFEPHINRIKSLGYDGMILYEGGIENYLSFKSNQYSVINDEMLNSMGEESLVKSSRFHEKVEGSAY